jgi:fatty acid desaturase
VKIKELKVKADTPEEAQRIMDRINKAIEEATKPPRFRFIHMMCYIAVGIALAKAGVHIDTWPFWVIMGAMAGASLCGQYGRWGNE